MAPSPDSSCGASSSFIKSDPPTFEMLPPPMDNAIINTRKNRTQTSKNARFASTHWRSSPMRETNRLLALKKLTNKQNVLLNAPSQSQRLQNVADVSYHPEFLERSLSPHLHQAEALQLTNKQQITQKHSLLQGILPCRGNHCIHSFKAH